MTAINIISIIVAVLAFFIIGYVGLKTNLLRENDNPDSKYSFRNFQLWIWTLVICPIFILHWSFGHPNTLAINITSLLLLGISSIALFTGNLISDTNQKNNAEKKAEIQKQKATDTTVITANLPTLKSESTTSNGFFVDIFTDDTGKMSVGRLQNFIFILIYITIYISFFFSNAYEYINWDKDPTPFVLMGISTGSYLFAKMNLK